MPAFSQLLRRAKSGDADAVRLLCTEYEHVVDRAARAGLGQFLHARFEPADIRQSVFGDMLRELPDVEDRGEPAFRNWLLAKVRNKICTKARRTVLSDGRRREERLGTAAGAVLPGEEPEPVASVVANEDAARLGRLLGTLDASDRAVIGLCLDEGLSWPEIARRLSLPSPDAARMRYVRALAALRVRWMRA